MRRLFVDTAYLIALTVKRDQYHEKAVELSQQLEKTDSHLTTTRAVLIEFGNWMSKPRRRQIAGHIIEEIENDPDTDILPVTDALFHEGLQLYRQRSDKSWSLADCLSFVVMRNRELTAALTADDHFEQAGFETLL